jgi:hypothetical protein
MSSAPLTRSFVALNGLEVKKAIISEFTRQLDADTRFSQHLSYARIGWKWKLATDAYPSEIGTIKLEGGGLLHPKEARQIEEGEAPIHIDLEGGTTVAAPVAGVSADEVRRQSGQPVPTPRQVRGPEGRITVDAPDIPRPARETQEQIEEPRVQTDSPSGKGVFAKRATLKTRANPKGVEPVQAQGTAPTQEDAEKIIAEGLASGTLEERGE